TGTCIHGCKEGFSTSDCSVQCDSNYYGQNCSMECPTKCFNASCDNVRGTCDDCLVGFMGKFCEK
ncbi:multiple epidermal growth factor-like domains protein 11, partial [Biomphalaria pfeifferi]